MLSGHRVSVAITIKHLLFFIINACVPGCPTFFLLLRRGAARGLVAGLLSHGDGRDDAGLAAQTPLLFLLLQVLQDVLGSLVGARHCPRREGFLEKGEHGGAALDQTAQRRNNGFRHTEDQE